MITVRSSPSITPGRSWEAVTSMCAYLNDHKQGLPGEQKALPLRTSDFDYYLPPELIAQEPLEKRDSSRMLVLMRNTGEVRHSFFADIPLFLENGDLLVFNDTRVLPARLRGSRKDTGGAVELLLVRRLEESKWEVLCSPGKRVRPGAVLTFGEGLLEAEVLSSTPSDSRIVRFLCADEDVLKRVGEVPLPPYIKKDLADRERYQTIYASKEGSSAAPTAGLHFSDAVLDRLHKKSIESVYITLHIGPGTFRPVKAEYVQAHTMHSEYYELSSEAAERINRVKEKGGRVVAVGTSCCRTLETLSSEDGRVSPGSGETELFIYPGYRYKLVDALLTNFHLPRSTLLMLVCAFAGTENIFRAYREAVQRRYRFYSFGDCMLIV